jgi:hypothetical protein
MTTIARPDRTEYAEYYHRYVDLVPDGPIVDLLASQIEETGRLLTPLSEERGAFRHAPGKWSVKEIVGHLTDSERVFAYRALRFSRGDTTALPGFEQDDYVANGGFDSRRLGDLMEEYRAVRRASVLLFGAMDGAASARRGTASGFPMSVRALAYVIAGHELHHRRVLIDRYLA